MNMKKLVAGILGCSCGMDHLCPIDHIEISGEMLSHLPAYCAGYQKILLVADQNTYGAAGAQVAAVLGEKIAQVKIFETGDGVLIPDEQAVAAVEAVLPADCDLVLGIGSGVINDLCKYVSFRHDLPYYIVATAPSMDGYASVGAAMILGGMKETVSARPPKAILADPKVLAEAPLEMLQAGYGDIVGKYSCLNDWKLSALINDEYFCQAVYDLTMDTVLKVDPLAEAILRREEEAVAALMEALVIVGVAMAYVKTSRPASGSEHHLSHFFEITGIVFDRPYFAHGIDVLYSAVVTAKLREQMQRAEWSAVPFDEAAWEGEIQRVYGSSASGVLALQRRLGWYEKTDASSVLGQEKAIRELLAQAPTEEQMLRLVERIGLKMEAFYELYGSAVEDAIRYAKDLKDRYSVLWLYDRFYRG